MEPLLTIEHVARLVNRSPKTIRRWIKEGAIAFVQLPGGGYGIRRENFENWIDKRTMKPIRY